MSDGVVGAVKVKPLVWVGDTDPDSDDFGAFVSRGSTTHLRYIVKMTYGGWKLTGAVPFGLPVFATVEAAKAAAQADYEARIMAALDVHPLTVQDAAQVPEIAALIDALKPFADIGVSENPDFQPIIRMDRDAIMAARAALRAISDTD